jgi:hypothetical protein
MEIFNLTVIGLVTLAKSSFVIYSMFYISKKYNHDLKENS